MKNNPYHESEEVLLVSKSSIARVDLHRFLKAINFKSIDDFYACERNDFVAPWQSEDILDVTPLCSGHAIYETEDDVVENTSTAWDSLICHYLLATLPVGKIDDAIKLIALIVNQYNLEIIYDKQSVSIEALRESFCRIAEHLEREYAAPGSEALAILIETEYPRR